MFERILQFLSSRTHLPCVLVACTTPNASLTRMLTEPCWFWPIMVNSWGRKKHFIRLWVRVSIFDEKLFKIISNFQPLLKFYFSVWWCLPSRISSTYDRDILQSGEQEVWVFLQGYPFEDNQRWSHPWRYVDPWRRSSFLAGKRINFSQIFTLNHEMKIVKKINMKRSKFILHSFYCT